MKRKTSTQQLRCRGVSGEVAVSAISKYPATATMGPLLPLPPRPPPERGDDEGEPKAIKVFRISRTLGIQKVRSWKPEIDFLGRIQTPPSTAKLFIEKVKEAVDITNDLSPCNLDAEIRKVDVPTKEATVIFSSQRREASAMYNYNWTISDDSVFPGAIPPSRKLLVIPSQPIKKEQFFMQKIIVKTAVPDGRYTANFSLVRSERK